VNLPMSGRLRCERSSLENAPVASRDTCLYGRLVPRAGAGRREITRPGGWHCGREIEAASSASAAITVAWALQSADVHTTENQHRTDGERPCDALVLEPG
jgi:hypothetical protein